MKPFSFPMRHAPSTRPASTRTATMRFGARGARRRSGVAFIYFGLALVALLGIAAYSVDMGFLYTKRAQVQRAADAAALGGAWQLSRGRFKADADTAAIYYAFQNGYNNNASGVDVTTQYPVPGEANWYQVTVKRTEPLFFGRIFGLNRMDVSARAAAIFQVMGQIPIPREQYGLDIGPDLPFNYSMFGPYAMKGNGDEISPIYNDNRSLNPLYSPPNANNSTGGYNFILNTPSAAQMRYVQVELFDPDCYNINNQVNASATAFDEIRSGQTGGSHTYTDTEYTLYWDNNTPYNFNDDVLVRGRGRANSGSRLNADASYGNDAGSDSQWVTPDGFVIDRNNYQTGNFRINVTTTDGSSENGFNMRAGPWRAVNNNIFNQNNATGISAQGRLPMNFNIDGTANINLGYVPATAAGANGGLVTVRKFDTDVEVVSLHYTCDTLPGQTFPGVLNRTSGAVSFDNITLPTNYQGGNWTAVYRAGSNDTSVWSISYTGVQGTPGSIKLIR